MIQSQNKKMLLNVSETVLLLSQKLSDCACVVSVQGARGEGSEMSFCFKNNCGISSIAKFL